MKKPYLVLPAFFLLMFCAAILLVAEEKKIPPMPGAVSSNAVAGIKGGLELYSLMGIGPRKTWDDITNKVYVLRLASAKWSEGRPVPGVAGRLGASAVGAKGKIFLFGGYVVDKDGKEITVSDVNGYVPEEHRWYRGSDIPTPVDQAVIGVTHDRFIYLIGGRARNGPINLVQIYDVEKNTWSQGTPFPGPPVFGHAGGVAEETIVYVDGAMKNPAEGVPYIASDQCWVGKIDHKDPGKIEWKKLPPHPGAARFGIAGGGAAEKDRRIFFSGGTASPHDFKGLGYDGKPAEVLPVSFAFDLHHNQWQTVSQDTFDPRTDSRGIVASPIGPVVMGGMVKGQIVTSRVVALIDK